MSEILDNFDAFENKTKETKLSIKAFLVFNDKISLSNGEDDKNIIFVTNDDKVYVFGKNASGCLAKNKNPIEKPTLVRELSDKRIIDFNNGGNHMIARNENRDIYCWGTNNFGQLGNEKISESLLDPFKNAILSGRDIIDIRCGDSHTLGRTLKGEVYAWGNNNKGQVGINSNDETVPSPRRLTSFFKQNIRSISCGSEHSIALSEDGFVYVWGSNSFGQLGCEETPKKYLRAPQSISLKKLEVNSIQKICCGSSYSCLLSSDGFIFVFGKIVLDSIEGNVTKPYRISHEEEFSDIDSNIYCTTSVALSKTNNFYELKNLNTPVVTEAGIKSTIDYFANKFQITINTIRIDIKKNEEKIDQPSPKVNIQNETKNASDSPNSKNPSDRYTDEFDELECIGAGAFGKVFKVLKKLDQHYYAVKKIDWEGLSVDRKNFVMKELKMMAGLNSDHVVQYKNSWEHGKLFFIQMELCEFTLKEILEKKRHEFNRSVNELIGNLEFYFSCELFKELVQCINFLHTHEPKIIHRDLKPSNILVTDGRNKRFVKIADFGISVFHEVDDKTHTALIGTKKYVAPEVEQGRVYGTASDIYGLGVITEEIFDISLNSNVELKRSANSITVENYELICDLIDQMRSPRMTKRPSCEKLLKEIDSIPMDFGALKDDAYFDKYASSHETSNIIEENFYYLFLKAKLKFV